MSELAKRLSSLVDSRASELDVDRQIVIQEMADEADLEPQDIGDLLIGDIDATAPAELYFRSFSIFGQDAAGELAGLYELEQPRLPQIREVIPRATYERLQAIKEELSQALAD